MTTSERESLLFKSAENEALVMHGTLDITIEQWAVIYDRIEWIFCKTATEKLGDIARHNESTDWYSAREEARARRTDRWVIEERRAAHRCVAADEASREVSFA